TEALSRRSAAATSARWPRAVPCWCGRRPSSRTPAGTRTRCRTRRSISSPPSPDTPADHSTEQRMTARARHLRPDPIGRRLLRAAATVVQVAVVAMALAVIALPLATDYQWRTVVSGSMRPVIHPGDVILTALMAKPPEVG